MSITVNSSLLILTNHFCPLCNALVGELKVLGAGVEHAGGQVLDQVFDDARDGVEILDKGHLSFDHPKLAQVPRRLVVLRPERRVEAVHVSQAAGSVRIS